MSVNTDVSKDEKPKNSLGIPAATFVVSFGIQFY